MKLSRLVARVNDFYTFSNKFLIGKSRFTHKSMPIRVLDGIWKEKMRVEHDSYQKLPKVTDLGVAPYISPTVKASVIAGYTAGKSLRKLAIEFRLGRPTVTKIVNKLRQERLVELSVDRFAELMDAAMESYKYALREELNGKRAAEFLKVMGIIPTCGCNACARGRKLNADQAKANLKP